MNVLCRAAATHDKGLLRLPAAGRSVRGLQLVESLITEVNDWVKRTEKFWDNPEGVEAIP